MSPSDIPHLVEAVAFYCEQQERREMAVFFNSMSAAQRAALGAVGERPWRGIMQPSLVGIINILEDAGHYEGPLAPQMTAFAS